MDEIIGAIYPVPIKFVDRLFDGKTKIFIKFVAHNTTRLMPRHKVVFYASHGSKELIGEGTIEKVEFLSPATVLTIHKDDLFLDNDELRSYVERSPSRNYSKEMLTLTLKKLKKYSKPVNYIKPITMAGQYLRADEYNSLFQKR